MRISLAALESLCIPEINAVQPLKNQSELAPWANRNVLRMYTSPVESPSGGPNLAAIQSSKGPGHR